MNEIHILPPERYGYDFIPPEYLPPGKDQYWRRNEQQEKKEGWRRLKPHETEILMRNGNYCPDWGDFFVSDPFEPALIRDSFFFGRIRLGALRDVLLKHHDFCVPAGIRNSRIISCDIGDDTVIQDCSYISHYIIGDTCILSRIDEMQCTNHAKFGNGVIKDGEDEDVRISIDVMNEAGGRPILPFRDMIPADAFLWAGYRDDRAMSSRLAAITQAQYGGYRGSYGTVGSGTVIKSCRIIKDCEIGKGAYIKGANKLKNVSILSSEEECTQIGEGVEMVNGIVGYGSHAFYGSKAVRFVMGRHSNLKYGARLIHSVLGDNSTVSCCEMLNNLVFPVHEQHHNNSFLIASCIQGLSNIAAGATIGSNHNSRANDGEIRAGRGFWPGLSVTLKHSSRFASFVLIAKGDYPYEMNISLPFSLLNNNANLNRLELMPAYFWMYNLYALERNSWKSRMRDRRRVKRQHIEMDYLAPDTAEEIISALTLLETWMRKAGIDPSKNENAFSPSANKKTGGEGRSLAPAESIDMEDPEYEVLSESVSGGDNPIPASGLERHQRGTVILKPRGARAAYLEMLRFYAIKTLAAALDGNSAFSWQGFCDYLEQKYPDSEISEQGRVREWINMGGQIVPAFRVDRLRKDIREGRIERWDEIHAVYGEWQKNYNADRARHAWAVLKLLRGENSISVEAFKRELGIAAEIKNRIVLEVYETRAKDFFDPYRLITYRNREEMDAVVGKPEDNSFVKAAEKEAVEFGEMTGRLVQRLGEGNRA
ncbi:MAG: DUF4954 family protein [Treponema sp.]|jgi:hypothetical protein|nr:DUF4954 family protein [Treponema sp.]